MHCQMAWFECSLGRWKDLDMGMHLQGCTRTQFCCDLVCWAAVTCQTHWDLSRNISVLGRKGMNELCAITKAVVQKTTACEDIALSGERVYRENRSRPNYDPCGKPVVRLHGADIHHLHVTWYNQVGSKPSQCWITNSNSCVDGQENLVTGCVKWIKTNQDWSHTGWSTSMKLHNNSHMGRFCRHSDTL